MTNFVEVIKACEAAEGAGTKAAIKEALSKADLEAQQLIHYALNPYLTYGVRKFPMPSAYAEEDADTDEFIDICEMLSDRDLTGNAARDAITQTLALYTEETASYLIRIFDKDLRGGFSRETVNKIFKDLVPVFDVMLAEKCETVEEFEASVTFPAWGSFKLDGQRTTVFVKEDEIVYYSRSGLEQEHLKGIYDEDLYTIRNHLGYDFVIDGESYGKDFTETMNAKKSGNDTAKAGLRLHAFFIMTMDEWVNQNCPTTMEQVEQQLSELVQKLQLKRIVTPMGKIVNNYTEMMDFCNEAIDKYKVEGLIVKELSATYVHDRTHSWTKVKRFSDIDVQIIGFYKGRAKSRLENTLGGLIVAGYTESGELVATACGSGFSDELRTEIYNNLNDWLYKTVVVKYQDITRSKGKVASLRFPVFQYGPRDDKTVEVPEDQSSACLTVLMKGRTPVR